MDLANLNYLLHGQVAHDFCGVCSKLILFLGVHHQQTCSIQSTSWWILGLVESSLYVLGMLCFGLLNYLVDGCPLHVCPLTQIPMAGYLEGYILKPKKFRHPKNTGWLHTTGSGYCNNWQSAAFTATNKFAVQQCCCVWGKKLKISEYLTQYVVVVATGHVIHAILDFYSWGEKWYEEEEEEEEEAWWVCMLHCWVHTRVN